MTTSWGVLVFNKSCCSGGAMVGQHWEFCLWRTLADSLGEVKAAGRGSHRQGKGGAACSHDGKAQDGPDGDIPQVQCAAACARETVSLSSV